jgi:hypothetical protein
VVLLVLAVLWGIVLIPPALRNRAEARQGRSVANFRKRLEVLAPPAVPLASRPATAVRPAGSAPPRMAVVAEPGLRRTLPPPAPSKPGPALRPSRAAVLRRRRQVFGSLTLAAVASLALAVAFPGLRLVAGSVHLLAGVALAAYVAGLRRLHQLARERTAKVRYLPVAVAVPIRIPDAGTAAEAPAVRSAAL